MSDKMYRYLEKYVGKYRVMAEYDVLTEDFPRDENGKIDESFEDLYIPCSKGKSKIMHTYRDGVLVWYTEKLITARNVKKELESKRNKIWFEYEETEAEALIYFNAKDIDEFAKLVNPKTNGASIKPFSDKNLPKPAYVIPDKDIKKLDNLTKDLDKEKKMLVMRKLVSNFDDEIIKKKGKKFNLTEDRKSSRLKPKVYIHSIGMWDDFIKYVKKNLPSVLEE